MPEGLHALVAEFGIEPIATGVTGALAWVSILYTGHGVGAAARLVV